MLSRLALVVGLTAFASGIARAETASFCNQYASKALHDAQQVRSNPRCNAPNLHGGVFSTDYNAHYTWCLGVDANRAYAGAAEREAYLNRCAAAAKDTFKKFSGTWIWTDRRRGTLPATLEFYPNRQGDARYCCPSSKGLSCFNIRYTVQGNAYVFTNNGVDWFSMSSPRPGVLNGRYWDRRTDVNLPPSANISMRQTAGSRP